MEEGYNGVDGGYEGADGGGVIRRWIGVGSGPSLFYIANGSFVIGLLSSCIKPFSFMFTMFY